MVPFVLILFAAAIYLVIRELQTGYNIFKVNSRFTMSKAVKIRDFSLILSSLLRKIAVLNSYLPLGKYREYILGKLKEGKAEKKYTPDEFLAYKELLAVAGLVLLVLLFGTPDLYMLGAFLGLFIYPDIRLKTGKTVYEKQIFKKLPFALDIITVCVEAGLTFDNAVLKYVSKARPSFLRTEFEDYLKDIKIGKQRAEALKDMGTRVNMQDFNNFISSIIQSERMGTSIAGILRLQNRQIRTKRVQRIEKQALQAPVKLMLPLVFFIFPVIFIVIFGPVIIRLLKIL